MTGVIPIQGTYFLITDAKPNIQFIILVQWTHISSESAVDLILL